MHAYKKTLTALFLLYILTNPLQAANVIDAGEDDQKEGSYAPTHLQEPSTVHDHTFLNNKNVKHILDDIEDVEDELEDTMLNVNRKLITTDNQSPPLLLAVVLQHKQSHKHYQYLITNTGLLSEATQPNAVKKAHKKGFHLIKATPQHVILQLLEWLQISKHYIVIALHTNRPVCRNCHLIANSLWKKELQTNEKGCFSTLFPLLGKMPSLAQQYINTHFHLSFVQSLLIPMMGYVSKEEMNKTIQQKEQEIASFIASMEATKDEQIMMLSNKIKTKDKQLDEKKQRIETLTSKLNNKNQRIKTLTNQLNNKQKPNNKKHNNNKNRYMKTLNKKIITLQAQAHQDNIKLNNKNRYIDTLNEQIVILQAQIQEKNKELKENIEEKIMLISGLEKKDEQLNSINQKLTSYMAHLVIDIAAKMNRLRNEFNITLHNIYIHNENSVKRFLLKASLETKQGLKQLNEDMQTLREWHAKYKGNRWKDFGTKNSDGVYWGEVYIQIKEKMEKTILNAQKSALFSSILRSLKAILSTEQAHLWNSNMVLKQNGNFKNENYRAEVIQLNKKLEHNTVGIPCWRWIK